MKPTKKPTASYAEKPLSNVESTEANKNYFEAVKPFAIVRNEKTKNKFKIAFANYILQKNYKSIEEAKAAIEGKDWDLLIDTIGIIVHLITNKEVQQ